MLRLAHVLVCHSVPPIKLLASIPHHSDDVWYVFLHSEDRDVEASVYEDINRRGGNIFPYKVNRGLAKSWNEGAHLGLEAKCDGVFLLNDDLFFYKGAYDAFRDTVVALRYHEDISMIFLNGLESGRSPAAGQVRVQDFACCLLTVHAFSRVGYFDQNFTPAYYEDSDYAHRCMLNGMGVHVDQRVLVEHERSSTLNKIDVDERSRLHKCIEKNGDYYFKKWGGGASVPVFRTPFDDPSFGNHIPFGSRGHPYGIGFDRDDLNK